MSDQLDNGAHAPVYAVTIGDKWVFLPAEAGYQELMDAKDIRYGTTFGTEEEARLVAELFAAWMKVPVTAARIVKFGVLEVLEG